MRSPCHNVPLHVVMDNVCRSQSRPVPSQSLASTLRTRRTVASHASSHPAQEKASVVGGTMQLHKQRSLVCIGGAPGPTTASIFGSDKSFCTPVTALYVLQPTSSKVNSTLIPPSKVGSALIRCTASAAAPGMVRPAFHDPVIGKSNPSLRTSSVDGTPACAPGQTICCSSCRYLHQE